MHSTNCLFPFLVLLHLAVHSDSWIPLSHPSALTSTSATSFYLFGSRNYRSDDEGVALPCTERTRAVQSAFTASSVFLTTFLAGAAGASMKVKADSLDSIPSASTPSDLTITDKVFLDIKIANYTEESTGRNRGATGSGKVVIGLYGKAAPESVKRFLATLDGDGETAPNFYNAQFSRIVEDNLLEVEKIRGVSTLKIAGTEQYEYKGNVLTDYKPILETNSISHNRAGYLTRRQLTSGPEFGITVSNNATSLDGFHVVFGTILEGKEVLNAISKIDRYSYTTKTGYTGLKAKGTTKSTDDLADKWFEAQKEFYGKFIVIIQHTYPTHSPVK